MKRLVFISNIASPHQVRFCYALQRYFHAEFWFYEHLSPERAAWWRVDLGDQCKILEHVLFRSRGPFAGRYFAPGLDKELDRFRPDIVMLGGFSIPSNWLAYRWAKRNGKKVAVFTERSRNKHGVLRKRSWVWRLIRYIYEDLDLVITSAEDAVPQFRDEFRFGEKVTAGRYAADLEAYFNHPLREPKRAYTYLFANRMTEIYNPVGAIEVFAEILMTHAGSRLLINAVGELADRCKARIAELAISDSVEFLTDIRSWEDLHKVYARSDILLLPAHFSNGNFTILEAMASGMGIVISNRVLGIGRLIEDGVNGFSCDPTSDAFLERVERYIHEPSLFQQHAALNRTRVQPFSAEGTARFYADTFEHLCWARVT